MERCGYLYGTVFEGEKSHYYTIANSADVHTFLANLGSVNHKATVDLVRSFLGDITMHNGYFAQPANERPVAVRYAPLALRSYPTMPNSLKTFYAMCINGFENVVGERAGKYAHLILMDPEGFYHSEGYNYLDRIFGTPLTSWQDVQAYKDKAEWLPGDFCKAMPSRVEPVMNLRDREVVTTAVEGIFTKKTVIIRLEKNYAFNRRAWELLLQIYALFTPRQAETFGFSIYEDPKNIEDLVTQTAIRLFVLPADAELNELKKRDSIIIDLATNSVIRGSADSGNVEALRDAIDFWYEEEWQQRQQIMETMFGNVRVFDAETYAHRTKEYLSDPFIAWVRKGGYMGTCTTLEEIKAQYDSFPICQNLTWAHELFCEIAPDLLKAPLKLADLAAQVLPEAMYSEDEELAGKKEDLFSFAEQLGCVELISAAQSVGSYVHELDLAAFREESARAKQERDAAVAAEQARTAQAEEKARADLENAQKERDQAVAAEQVRTAQAEEKARADLENAQKERDQAVAAEQARTAQAKEKARADLENAQEERDRAVAAEQARTAQAEEKARADLENAKKERNQAVAAEQAVTAKVREESRLKLSEAQEREVALSKELDRQKRDVSALSQKLASEHQTCVALNKQNIDLEQKLADETVRYKELEQIRRASDLEASRAKAEVSRVKAENESIKRDAENQAAEAKQKVTAAEQDAAKARKELNDIKSSGTYKPDKKMLAAAAGIGLAVALLLGGAAFAIGRLVGNDQNSTADPPIPAETTIEFAAPTTEPAVIETIPVTEVTETLVDLEPQAYAEYEHTITEQMLMAEIPDIKHAVTEDLNTWIPGLEAVGEYAPASLFLLTEEEMDSETLNRYAVLFVAEKQDSENLTEDASAQDRQTDDTDAEQLPDAAESDSTDAALEEDAVSQTELVVPDIAGARLVLVSERYILALYGDNTDAVTALKVFTKLVPEEADVALRWYLGEKATDIVPLVTALMKNDQCWRFITAVSMNEVDMAEGQALLQTEDKPILYLQCGETGVFLFEKILSSQAETLASELNSSGYSALVESRLVAVAVQ